MALILNRESNPPTNFNEAPVVGFVSLILSQAIRDKVDTILFKLDQELHAKAEAEFEQSLSKISVKVTVADLDVIGKAVEIRPKAFSITFKVGEKEFDLAPADGEIFAPAVNVILNAAEMPYWAKGNVAGEFETEKPYSKWKVESPDLARMIQLKLLAK